MFDHIAGKRRAIAMSSLLALALGGVAMTATAVHAATTAEQPVQGNILEEVVVTAARKRSENVQTTPIAITSIGEAALQRAHVTDFSTLGNSAPNLQIFRAPSSGDGVNVYLRGFGAQGAQPAVDPHVAIFLDGIYQPEINGALLDMFDISRVEVDAGPQGTLSGKNAAIGAIYITSDKPTGDFSGEIEGDYGSYDHFGARAKVNVPLVQNADGTSILAGKVSFVEKEGGNWILNTLTGDRDMGGENEKAARLGLVFTPGSAFEWDVSSAMLLQRDPQMGLRAADSFGAVPGTSSSVTQIAPRICNPRPGGFGAGACVPTAYGTTDSIYTNSAPSDTVEVASTMTYRLAPVTLTSVTGFISYWRNNNADISGTPFNILTTYNSRERYDQESEEFRISSVKNGGLDFGGKIDWVIGGFFSNHQYSAAQNLGVLAAPGTANSRSLQNGVDQSTAVFAHLIYNFTDQWTGTFGVRQTWDQKNHDYQVAQGGAFAYDTPIGFHNTSFEAGTAYQFDPSRMAYFRFAQGYAAGGYVGFPSVLGGGSEFQEETNNSYEVGVKSDWLNKRLRVNVDLFHNELSNLQLSGVKPLPTPPFLISITSNAGSATVEGLESQIIAIPVEDLTMHLNLGYLRTKYNKYFSTVCSNVASVATDCSGIPFGFSPKWTMDLGGDYAMPLPHDWGTADFSADWYYKSSYYASDPAFPGSYQGGFGLVNAGLKFTDQTGMYSLEFYGTNILDRRYKLTFADAGGLTEELSDGRPAEWGLRVIMKFGP